MRGSLERIPVPGDQRKAGSCGSERYGNSLPQPPATSGDYGDTASQSSRLHFGFNRLLSSDSLNRRRGGGFYGIALGVGAKMPGRDREIVSVTAVESASSDATVDVAVEAVAHGYGAAPVELRLLDEWPRRRSRRAKPAARACRASEVVMCPPSRDAPTVYTV